MATKTPSKTVRISEAISNIAPDKARELSRKYRKVMSSVAAAELIGSTFDKTNLETITEDLLKIKTSAHDQAEIDRRKQLVTDFDVELDLLSSDIDSLSPALLDHDEKVHEKNKFTQLEKSIAKAFDNAVAILEKQFGGMLKTQAIHNYLRKNASPGVKPHQVGLFRLLRKSADGKNESALWTWANQINGLRSNALKLTAIQNLTEKYLLAHLFQNPTKFFKTSVKPTASMLRRWPLLASLLKTPPSSVESFNFVEVTRITEAFINIEGYFGNNALYANLEPYRKSYNGVVPIDDVETRMCNIFQKVDNERKRDYLSNNQSDLYTALGLLCNGMSDRADTVINELLDNLLFLDKCVDFRAKTGLKHIKDRDINGMASMIVLGGIEKDKSKAFAFVIKYLKKLRAVDPTNFTAMAENMSSIQLAKFITAMIVASPKKLPTATKLVLYIEAQYHKDVKKQNGIIASESKRLRTHLGKLKKLQKRPKLKALKEKLRRERQRLRRAAGHVDISKHKRKVAELQEKIADYSGPLAKDILVEQSAVSDAMTKITNHRKLLLRAQIRRDIARSFLFEKKADPSKPRTKAEVESLYTSDTAEHFEMFCHQHKITVPATLRLMQLTEFGRSMLNFDREWDIYLLTKFDDKLRKALNLYLATGKLTKDNKRMVEVYYEEKTKFYKQTIEEQASPLKSLSDEFTKILAKYPDLEKVPQAKRAEIAMKMTAYMGYLSSLSTACGKLLGMFNTLKLLGNNVSAGMVKYRKMGEEYNKRLKEVTNFLLIQDASVPSMSALSVTPYQKPLLDREFKKFDVKLQGVAEDIQYRSNQTITAQKRFKNYKNAPAYLKDRMVGVDENFKFAIGAIDKLHDSMLDGRKKIQKEFIPALEKMLAISGSAAGLSPAMKLLRTKIIRERIASLKKALTDSESPFSISAISSIFKSLVSIRSKYANFESNRKWAFALMVAVVIVACGFAVLGGWAAGLAGKAIFGTVVAGTVTSAGAITVGAGVSTFATTVMTAYGVGIGAAFGARVAMQGFSWSGALDLGGWKKIWNPEDFLYDAAVGTCVSLAAIGVANVLVKTFARMASSTKYAWMARMGKGGERLTKGLERLVNPTKWFNGKGIVTSKAALQSFGARVTTEGAQEFAEKWTEIVAGPVGGLVAAMLNSTDGVNVKTTLDSVDAKEVGMAMEGRNLVYTTVDAKTFVSNLQTHFNAKPGVDFNAIINKSDGSVTLSLLTKVLGPDGKPIIDPKTGLPQVHSPVMIDVEPAQLDTNMDIDARLARIEGLDISTTGEFSIADGAALATTVEGLHTRGLPYVFNSKGILVTIDGIEHQISIDQKIMQGFNMFAEAQAELLTLDKQRDSKGKLPANLKARARLAFATLSSALLMMGCDENSRVVKFFSTVGGILDLVVLGVGGILAIPAYRGATQLAGQLANFNVGNRYAAMVNALSNQSDQEYTPDNVINAAEDLQTTIGVLRGQIHSFAFGKSRAQAARIVGQMEVHSNLVATSSAEISRVYQEAMEAHRVENNLEVDAEVDINDLVLTPQQQRIIRRHQGIIRTNIGSLRQQSRTLTDRLENVNLAQLTALIGPALIALWWFSLRDLISGATKDKKGKKEKAKPKKPAPSLKMKNGKGVIKKPTHRGGGRTPQPAMRGGGRSSQPAMRGGGRAPWSGMKSMPKMTPRVQPMAVTPRRMPKSTVPDAMGPNTDGGKAEVL